MARRRRRNVVAVALRPFEAALRESILAELRRQRRDGITRMAVGNLMQVVRPPSQFLDGAPRGTNAQYYYAEMFRGACAALGM